MLSDDPAKRGILPKLATVYTEKLQKPDLAVAAWKTLLDAEPENRRAQDALRKLYCRQGLGRARGFYSVQGKWDEFARVLERQAETETGEARVGLWNKIAVLYREPSQQAGQGAEGIREDALLDGHNLVAAERSFRCTRETRTPSAWPGFCRCNSNTPRTRPSARNASLRIAQILEGDAGDKPLALTVALQGAIRESARGMGARIRRAGRRDGQLGLLVEAYEAVLPSLQDRMRFPFWPQWRELTRRSWPTPRRPSSATGRFSRSRIATSRPYWLSNACMWPPAARPVVAIYDKKLALPARKDEKREVRLQLAALYEEQVHDADKAIELYKDILKTAKEDVQALRALDRLYRATERWKDLSKIIVRQLKAAQ